MAGVEPVLGAAEPARPALRGRGLDLRGAGKSAQPTLEGSATRLQEGIKEMNEIFLGRLAEYHALGPSFSIEDIRDVKPEYAAWHEERLLAVFISV